MSIGVDDEADYDDDNGDADGDDNADGRRLMADNVVMITMVTLLTTACATLLFAALSASSEPSTLIRFAFQPRGIPNLSLSVFSSRSSSVAAGAAGHQEGGGGSDRTAELERRHMEKRMIVGNAVSGGCVAYHRLLRSADSP